MSIARAFAGFCAVALCVALMGCSSGSSSGGSSASTSSAASSNESALSTTSESSQASASSTSASEGSANASEPASASASDTASAASSSAAALANGEYVVSVDTDSTMFHINEADEGKGTLTVSDDGMTVHIRLASKKITKLYAGTVDEAKADPAGIIDPTTDTVTYSDGQKEEVFGFDVPVPALDTPFDVAILGSKGNWYDHKVTVSNPVSK